MTRQILEEPVPRDWSEIPKGATPEAVVRALLQPRKPLPPKRV